MKENLDAIFNQDGILSVVQFPHPLTNGGFVIVINAEPAHQRMLIADLQKQISKKFSTYFIPHDTLFQISQPGVFAPPFHINERPHLPFYLKDYGQLRAGAPIQEDILLPTYDHTLVQMHIGACRESFRRYAALPSLFHKQYDSLILQIQKEIIHLLATAVLTKGEWDISRETIINRFEAHFPNHHLATSIQTLQQIPNNSTSKEGAHRALFQFEKFLNELAAEMQGT